MSAYVKSGQRGKWENIYLKGRYENVEMDNGNQEDRGDMERRTRGRTGVSKSEKRT